MANKAWNQVSIHQFIFKMPSRNVLHISSITVCYWHTKTIYCFTFHDSPSYVYHQMESNSSNNKVCSPVVNLPVPMAPLVPKWWWLDPVGTGQGVSLGKNFFSLTLGNISKVSVALLGSMPTLRGCRYEEAHARLPGPGGRLRFSSRICYCDRYYW